VIGVALVTLDQLIDHAGHKCPEIRKAFDGNSTDPLALWLVHAIRAGYKDDGDFDQLTKVAESIRKGADAIYDVWSHLIDFADGAAEDKPKNYNLPDGKEPNKLTPHRRAASKYAM
jgi:hypothetical protein